jgi:hypothetical protein
MATVVGNLICIAVITISLVRNLRTCCFTSSLVRAWIASDTLFGPRNTKAILKAAAAARSSSLRLVRARARLTVIKVRVVGRVELCQC